MTTKFYSLMSRSSIELCKTKICFIIARILEFDLLFSYVVNGAYTLKMPLDDRVSMLFNLYNFQGGQYKKMGDRKLDRYCETMYVDNLKSYFEKFQASTTNPTPWKACPFPPGRNEVKNYLFEENGILPPYIPGGEKWKAEVRFFHNDSVLGGYDLYAIIRNDEKLLG